MNKLYLFVFIVSVLLSCKNNDVISNAEFKRCVGEWENIDGEESIHFSITSNGKIRFTKSTERQLNFRIKSFQSDLQTLGWTPIKLNGQHNILFEINQTNDSILLKRISFVSNSHVESYSQYLKRKL
jgi:hypothetical protein